MDELYTVTLNSKGGGGVLKEILQEHAVMV